MCRVYDITKRLDIAAIVCVAMLGVALPLGETATAQVELRQSLPPDRDGDGDVDRPPPSEEEKNVVTGRLLDDDNGKLLIRTDEKTGERRTMEIAPKTEIMLNGNRAGFADLKPGDAVKVTPLPGNPLVAGRVTAARVVAESDTRTDAGRTENAQGANQAQNSEAQRQGGLGVVVSATPNAGVQVLGVVHGSPAHQAGITAGDFIVSLNERRVESPQAFVSAIQKMRPRETVQLGVWQFAAQQATNQQATTQESATQQTTPQRTAQQAGPQQRTIEVQLSTQAQAPDRVAQSGFNQFANQFGQSNQAGGLQGNTGATGVAGSGGTTVPQTGIGVPTVVSPLLPFSGQVGGTAGLNTPNGQLQASGTAGLNENGELQAGGAAGIQGGQMNAQQRLQLIEQTLVQLHQQVQLLQRQAAGGAGNQAAPQQQQQQRRQDPPLQQQPAPGQQQVVPERQ